MCMHIKSLDETFAVARELCKGPITAYKLMGVRFAKDTQTPPTLHGLYHSSFVYNEGINHAKPGEAPFACTFSDTLRVGAGHFHSFRKRKRALLHFDDIDREFPLCALVPVLIFHVGFATKEEIASPAFVLPRAVSDACRSIRSIQDGRACAYYRLGGLLDFTLQPDNDRGAALGGEAAKLARPLQGWQAEKST